MSENLKQNKWACVAGAGEGLGAAFAREMAKSGYSLILIDKFPDKLDLISGEIRSLYKVEIITPTIDLEAKNAADIMLRQIKDVRCNFLIYNAAYGPVKPFLFNAESELDRYIDVNIRTLTKLTHGFIKLNIGRKPSILFVSSLAGWRGTKLVVPYAATKAYIWNFAEGLYYEYKGGGVKIGVCIPGATDTPNYRSTNPRKTKFSPEAMDPNEVANYALTHFGKKTLFNSRKVK